MGLVSLIVASRNRGHHLASRIPIWTKAGYDEVIIVNTVTNEETARFIRDLCVEHEADYVEVPSTVRDTRSRARNLGAKRATSAWVIFNDDDDGVVARLNQETFARLAHGADWMAASQGEHIHIHRREAFLRFGGYPEDMVNSEDMIMSNRARRFGKGQLEDGIYEEVVPAPKPPREDPLLRAPAVFWYSYTTPLYHFRTPKLYHTVVGDLRRFFIHLKKGWKQPRHLVYFVLYTAGRLLSPLHLLGVLIRSGRKGFEREPHYAPWAPVRPDPPRREVEPTPKRPRPIRARSAEAAHRDR